MTDEMPEFITADDNATDNLIFNGKQRFFLDYANVSMQFFIMQIFRTCFTKQRTFDGAKIERIKLGFKRIQDEDSWGDSCESIDGTAEFFGLGLDGEHDGLKLLWIDLRAHFPYDAKLDILRENWLDPIQQRWPEGFGANDMDEIFRIGLGDQLHAKYQAAKLGAKREPSAERETRPSP